MRKLFPIFLLASLCVRRDDASERVQLAKRLGTLMGLGHAMDNSLAMIPSAVGPSAVDAAMNNIPAPADLSPDKRAKMREYMLETLKTIQQNMREEIKKSMDLGKELEAIFSPIYGKNFTADELKAMI